MVLSSNNLFDYLPQIYFVEDFDNDEDAIYGLAHNIVIATTQVASTLTGLEFEDFDEDREDAIMYVIQELKETNK